MPTSDYKIVLDLPSATPALGFDQSALALKEIIEGSQAQFAIGIFGSWGSGKTTLMRAIEARLDPVKTIAVQFSAWRYEKEQHLIVPLLDTIRQALVDWGEKNPAGLRREAIETASTIGKAIYSLVAGLSFKIGIPNAMEVSYKANESLAKAHELAEEERAARIPRSFYYAAFQSLAGAFRQFAGPSASRRIVVFVDDLDRCLPQGALEVLEAMKLFFDVEGFVFVVGLDREVVERSIDLKYRTELAGQQAALQIRGSDYIKKIFQVPYSLAPVAITQLEDFLEVVLSEAALPLEQEQEFRQLVMPHLRYIVGETGVNPREIKRYLNAFTLVIKIKPHLDRTATLTLQTISFRSDWEAVRRALLSYREVFTNAMSRQVSGDAAEATALTDLDPTLAAIPDSFLTYVTPPNPGHGLLAMTNLDEYLYAGEAARSTLGASFIDLIRDVARLAQPLRELQAGRPEDMQRLHSTYTSLALSLIGRIKEVSRSSTERILQGWSNHLNESFTFGPNVSEPTLPSWIKEEESFTRKTVNFLMEIYSAGGQTGSAQAA